MDGYALRAADRGPWMVIGSAPAGHPFTGSVGPDQAVRLFTGSLIPAGADAVVLQEDADRDGERLTLREAPVVRGGYLPIPEKPGWGIELNEEAFRHYPPRPWRRGFGFGADGSVGFI